MKFYLMPPAARAPFVKGALDPPKLLLQGACIVILLVPVFPTACDELPEGLSKSFCGAFFKKRLKPKKSTITFIYLMKVVK
jgi:hypothetical protein